MASTKRETTKRGAQASRSAVSEFQPRAKPAKPTKPVKAKAKPSKPSKPAKSKPAKPAKSMPAKSKPAKPAPHVEIARPAHRTLGAITVPSGKLAIFDIGLFGYLPRPALEPAIVTADVPTDRPLTVIGVPVAQGRFTACWDHVAVVLGDGAVASSKKLGEAAVDFGQLICMDHAVIDHWQHEDSLDGRADFVFWGRDAALLAAVVRAPRLEQGYGWTNLTVAEAEAKADEAARRKASNKWLLAAELRPHSHHFQVVAAAHRGPHGAGTLELAGAQILLFSTTWGNGVFPIYQDLGADDQPVQVRIQLATPASQAAMSAVRR
ncbi:MAG: hypothetical protein H6Q90_2256 [Deltaproteobacteria bacterium]|nr:hypothetical protein [Deltaproteobacteria bacterium]